MPQALGARTRELERRSQGTASVRSDRRLAAMRTRVVLEPAYLLNRRLYQDSSLLLEAYTRNHGRVGLVARGARGPKSKLRGVLQTFSPLLLSWSTTDRHGPRTGRTARGPT